jgi:hypothetical protein
MRAAVNLHVISGFVIGSFIFAAFAHPEYLMTYTPALRPY